MCNVIVQNLFGLGTVYLTTKGRSVEKSILVRGTRIVKQDTAHLLFCFASDHWILSLLMLSNVSL